MITYSASLTSGYEYRFNNTHRKRAMFLIFAALAFTGIAACEDWTHLHVKFALWNGFYDMPLTVEEINQDDPPKFVKMDRDDDLNVDLYSYPNDPRVSILFDSYGNIGGLRTAYIKADVAKRAELNNMKFNYSYDDKPMFTSGNYWGVDLWYTSVLFVSPEKLKAGGRQNTDGVVAEDVYVKLNGNWTLISRDECQVETQGFTKQACFLGMGMHYFYEMTPDIPCGDLQGVFLLYEYKQLIGLGIIPFGSFTSKDRTWFEDPSANVVKDIVPSRPDCLTDWVTDYGTTSLHIFFKKHPRFTFCTWPWQQSCDD
uniref:Uncharacterized protein n=1 Tax=Homalodisca liturata TaxID=320908 RepID=A0A1B6J7C4_9HEMI